MTFPAKLSTKGKLMFNTDTFNDDIHVSHVRPCTHRIPIFLQETSGCAPTKELCQNPILYLRQVFDIYNFVLLKGTWQFFHHPTSNVLKLTKPSWFDKNYACVTRFSLAANRFHAETSGRFAFT